MNNRNALTLATVMCLSLCLSACSASDAESDPPVSTDATFEEGTAMAEIAEAGTVSIGVAFDKPYFGLRGLDGEMEGFDVRVAKLMAAELGIAANDIEWVETVSANREPYIEQGRVDFVVATYTINDERKKVVSFAGPYLIAGQSILVGEGNPLGIESVEDVAGHQICGVTGSTGYENIRTNYPELAENLVGFDTYSKCGDALANGQVDVVTADNTTLTGIISDHPDDGFSIVGESFTEEPYGIGLKQDDEFRAFLNDSLEKIIENGEWEKAFTETAGQVMDVVPDPPKVDRY